MTIEIADLRAGEVDAVAAIHVRSWQAAYRGIFPDDYLAALDPASRAEWRRRRLAGLVAPSAMLVARLGGTPIGFADIGPARSDADPPVGEVYAIYLDPDHWGIGAGRALMDAAMERLSGAFSSAVLWVLIDNHRARRFYEAAGWRADGVRRIEEIAGVQANELRYAVDLDTMRRAHS